MDSAIQSAGDAAAPAESIIVSIWRGREDGGFQTYQLSQTADQTVLDLLTVVQREHDATLAYRFACRVGMCGSCAMRVNGRARWTCRTLVREVLRDGALTLQPLANLPIVKDLVTDMRPFFERWQRAGGVFRPPVAIAAEFAPIQPGDADRDRANAAIECINCGCCYSACEVVAKRPDYLGPAALNRAYSLQYDARDGARDARLRSIAGAGGCIACHSHHQCTAVCPVALNPAQSIAGLKRLVARAALAGRL